MIQGDLSTELNNLFCFKTYFKIWNSNSKQKMFYSSFTQGQTKLEIKEKQDCQSTLFAGNDTSGTAEEEAEVGHGGTPPQDYYK